jgi:hypothetical protein
MPLNRWGVYYYSTTIFTALKVPLEKTGGLGGVPLEIPPSRDKTISHGLDAVGGSVAFSVRFQAVLKIQLKTLRFPLPRPIRGLWFSKSKAPSYLRYLSMIVK